MSARGAGPLGAASRGASIARNVLGVTGWSGSGKTELLTAMTRILIARGVSVSTIKHAHHGFDVDRPGKDSFRHREAGAREVLVSSGRRWALMHELDGPEPSLAELLGHLGPVDVVLVEGYKRDAHPKIEVFRPALGQPPLWPGRADIVAVATDGDVAGAECPVLPLNDPSGIVDWAMRFLAAAGASHARA